MPDASSAHVIWIVVAALAAAVIGAIVLYNQLVAKKEEVAGHRLIAA
jgi:hypothetical protein